MSYFIIYYVSRRLNMDLGGQTLDKINQFQYIKGTVRSIHGGRFTHIYLTESLLLRIKSLQHYNISRFLRNYLFSKIPEMKQL
jgi:hypothetical protein